MLSVWWSSLPFDGGNSITVNSKSSFLTSLFEIFTITHMRNNLLRRSVVLPQSHSFIKHFKPSRFRSFVWNRGYNLVSSPDALTLVSNKTTGSHNSASQLPTNNWKLTCTKRTEFCACCLTAEISFTIVKSLRIILATTGEVLCKYSSLHRLCLIRFL